MARIRSRKSKLARTDAEALGKRIRKNRLRLTAKTRKASDDTEAKGAQVIIRGPGVDYFVMSKSSTNLRRSGDVLTPITKPSRITSIDARRAVSQYLATETE